MQDLPAIALVAEDVSLQRGPDAARALHYFKGLRARGLDVHLVTHEAHGAALRQALAGDEDRIHGVESPRASAWLGRLGLLLPVRTRGLVRLARSVVDQRALRRRVSQLVHRNGVRIVHQVTPVRPGRPSRIQGLGVPVVMGPLREAREAPPAFQPPTARSRRLQQAFARGLGWLAHRLFAGRRRADVLLVSDAHSSRAVPRGHGRKLRLPAQAIEVSEWKARDELPARDQPEFLCIGRLTPDSGADLLLDAFRLSLDASPARLRIVGEGPLADALAHRIKQLDLGAHVELSGWLSRDARRRAIETADVYVSPALGDADAHTENLMHAMSTGLPVVATDWGARADLARDGAGLLVGPRTRQQFTQELANVMHRLADSPSLRRELGARARSHARTEFDWSQRIDRLLDVYRLVA